MLELLVLQFPKLSMSTTSAMGRIVRRGMRGSLSSGSHNMWPIFYCSRCWDRYCQKHGIDSVRNYLSAWSRGRHMLPGVLQCNSTFLCRRYARSWNSYVMRGQRSCTLSRSIQGSKSKTIADASAHSASSGIALPQTVGYQLHLRHHPLAPHTATTTAPRPTADAQRGRRSSPDIRPTLQAARSRVAVRRDAQPRGDSARRPTPSRRPPSPPRAAPTGGPSTSIAPMTAGASPVPRTLLHYRLDILDPRHGDPAVMMLLALSLGWIQWGRVLPIWPRRRWRCGSRGSSRQTPRCGSPGRGW